MAVQFFYWTYRIQSHKIHTLRIRGTRVLYTWKLARRMILGLVEFRIQALRTNKTEIAYSGISLRQNTHYKTDILYKADTDFAATLHFLVKLY